MVPSKIFKSQVLLRWQRASIRHFILNPSHVKTFKAVKLEFWLPIGPKSKSRIHVLKVESPFALFKSVLDTRSEQKSMVFFITDHSELSLVDSACSGPLPRVDNHMQRLLLPEMNIEVESADAGVAFVTGKSKLTMEKVLFENYPSIRGTIFLEDSSRLFCEDSEIVNSLALYGGAMYSEDSEIVLNNAWIHKTASSRGGAILLHGLSSCDLQNSTFESNYAIQGGALFIEIDECSFKKESNLP